MLYLDSELIIFGGWSNNSGRKFNAMVSSTQNEYNEDGVYLYSLNTKTCTWEKSRYNGQIPSSKLNYINYYLKNQIFAVSYQSTLKI